MVSHFICKKNLILFLHCPAPMKSEQTGEYTDEMREYKSHESRQKMTSCSFIVPIPDFKSLP